MQGSSRKPCRSGWTVLTVIVLGLAACAPSQPTTTSTTTRSTEAPGTTPTTEQALIPLPPASEEIEFSLEQALRSRRSVREFSDSALKLAELGRLLWAAQGITSPQGGRTAPSAGGLYPLELLVVAGRVEGLEPGVYRYRPRDHSLLTLDEGDLRGELAKASLGQRWVAEGAVDIVMTGVYTRTESKYGDRGRRYVLLEAGHAAQNICLQAVALGLGTVTVGAFDDDRVREILGLTAEESPLYVLPVGRPRAEGVSTPTS